MYTVLPDEIKPLDVLADDLIKSRPSRQTSESTLCFSAVPLYTRDLGVAVTLIPHGWWFHLSHMEAAGAASVGGPGP
jgi:hypothetical protein